MDARITPDKIEAAKATQREFYVPTSDTLAQGAEESAYWTRLPPGSFNCFGIKAVPGQPFVTCRTREVINGRDVYMMQDFAKYASWQEAFRAHGQLLAHGSYYRDAMKIWLKGDLIGGIMAMAKHYATDPRYATSIISIIRVNALDVLDREVANEKHPTPPVVKVIAKVATAHTTTATATAAAAAGVTNHTYAAGAMLLAAAISAFVSWLLRPRKPPVVTPDRVPLANLVLHGEHPDDAPPIGQAESHPSSPAASAAAASAILPAATKASTMDLSNIVSGVASIAAAGNNPISGMLAGAKIASGALPIIFDAVKSGVEHRADIEAKFADLEARLASAWQNAQHFDVNALESDLGKAWSDGMGIYDDVGLPRSLVQQVEAVASGNNASASFATEAENVVEALAKQFGLPV